MLLKVSLYPRLSIYPQNAAMSVLQPQHTMSIPGTSEAPKFDGHFLSDFLEDLKLHFVRAGITDEDKKVN